MASKDESSKESSEGSKESPQAAEELPAMSTTDYLSYLLGAASLGGPKEKPAQLLSEVSVGGVVDYIRDGKAKNIVTMVGAGISTSAGIPDFRSPDSGLYDNLEKYNLPDPMAIFDLGYFNANPEPFFQLAKELWPGVFKPTPCHYFIKLLQEKGLLLRHYTQNIDTLERVAGLDGDCIVEAHGTFHTAHCLDCRAEYSQDWMKDQVFKDMVPKCPITDCQGTVKPDIIFFGEALPERFFDCANKDLKQCDLLIVLGTSLVVQPFASLANKVPETCPRMYINLEKSAGGDPIMAMLGYGHGFKFDDDDNYRDVFFQGTCDDGCQELADRLGWGDELRSLVATEHKNIDKNADKDKTTPGADEKKDDEDQTNANKL